MSYSKCQCAVLKSSSNVLFVVSIVKVWTIYLFIQCICGRQAAYKHIKFITSIPIKHVMTGNGNFIFEKLKCLFWNL